METEQIPFDNEILSDDEPVWTCPYCGEEGGEPVTTYSRYLYGADYDGNRGEWREGAEEQCTKCARRSYSEYAAADMAMDLAEGF